MNDWYGCEGCGRIATSANDLLRQGCEGRIERLAPLARLIEASESLARAEEQLRQIGEIVARSSRSKASDAGR